MRVLIAGQTYYPACNGQAIFSVNLAENLVKQGHEVNVVVPSYLGPTHRTERNGVLIFSIQAIELSFLHTGVYFTPFPGIAVRQIFKYFRPDIVHIQDHYPISASIARFARSRGVKVIGTNHFMPENLIPYFPWPVHLKLVYERALWWWVLNLYNRLDIATAPSKTAAAILRHQGLKIPVYAISCGVDTNRFHTDPRLDRKAWRQRLGLNPERTVFLYVGRMDREKRLDVILRAQFLMDREDVDFIVAGTGAARRELEILAEKLNLLNRVHFIGFVPDENLPKLINCADVFVMPSEAELLSIATLEAMSCGLPVLAARAKALPELVTEGVNGYLFRPGDEVDAARYMNMLVNQAERWPSMGAASLEKAHLHSLENTIRIYETLYTTLSARPVVAYPRFRSYTRPRGPISHFTTKGSK